MKIHEAAEYLGVTTAKLIDELTAKYPEREWKTTDQLPEEFVELVEQHAKHYQSETTQGELTASALNSLNTAQTLDAIEYGLLEAFEQFRLEDLEIRATVGAVRDWQKYKQIYASTLGDIYQREMNQRSAKSEEIFQSLISTQEESNKSANQLLGELQKTQSTIQSRMEKLKTESQSVLKALVD